MLSGKTSSRVFAARAVTAELKQGAGEGGGRRGEGQGESLVRREVAGEVFVYSYF